jgi:hypothetical protein
MAPEELDRLSREDLIAKARVLGVERAELMTRLELKDEVIRRSEPDAVVRQRSRGWLGVARDLVASVVESGLNLRDAASLIRGEPQRGADELRGPAPVATVTLAEIYAAQGHYDRALDMLEEVLEREPEHEPARALQERLLTEREGSSSPAERRRRQPESEPPESPPLVTASAPEAEVPPPIEPAPEESEAPEPIQAVRGQAPLVRAEAEPREPALVVLRDRDRVYLYWEVPPAGSVAAGNGAEQPALVARTVHWVPRGPTPERVERDYELTAPVGGTAIYGLAPGGLLRAALGYRDGERFRPLAVASELSLSPAGIERRFSPLGSDPLRLEAAEARATAHVKRVGAI